MAHVLTYGVSYGLRQTLTKSCLTLQVCLNALKMLPHNPCTGLLWPPGLYSIEVFLWIFYEYFNGHKMGYKNHISQTLGQQMRRVRLAV